MSDIVVANLTVFATTSVDAAAMLPTRHDLALDAALLIGFSLGMLLYGVLSTMFFPAVILLLRRQRDAHTVCLSLTALWLLATVQIVLWSVDMYRGFVKYRLIPGPHFGTDGTLEYFCFTSTRLPVIQDFPYYLSVVITDSIIVWRLWVVWPNKRWLCVIPGSLLVGSIVSGAVMLARQVVSLDDRSTSFQPRHSLRWGIVWFGFVLATNVIATGLIVGRLWWVSRIIPLRSSSKTYTRIASAIMESAALYTMALLVQLVLTALDMVYASQLMLYILPMLASLAPVMNILHIQLSSHSPSSPSPEDADRDRSNDEVATKQPRPSGVAFMDSSEMQAVNRAHHQSRRPSWRCKKNHPDSEAQMESPSEETKRASFLAQWEADVGDEDLDLERSSIGEGTVIEPHVDDDNETPKAEGVSSFGDALEVPRIESSLGLWARNLIPPISRRASWAA